VDIVENALEFSSNPFNKKPVVSLDYAPMEYIDEYAQANIEVYKNLTLSDSYSKLLGMLTDLQNIDTVSFLFEKRHRDHFSHQFNVYGIGLLLLNAVVKDQQTLKHVIGEKLEKTEDDVDFLWMVAALFHDHTYPIEYLLKIGPRFWQLKKSETRSKVKSLGEALFNTIPRIYDSDIVRPNTGLDNTDTIRDKVLNSAKEILVNVSDDSITPRCFMHDVLSAVNLLIKIKDKHQELLPALQAIARHHMEGEVDFEKEPLVALLRLCDELHEWGRPVLTDQGFKCPINAILLNFEPSINGTYRMPEKLDIEFCCDSREILEATKWRENIFWEDKQKAMGTIRLFPKSSDIRPYEMEMTLKVPSQIYT
jgi:hypothetical protein